MLATALGKTITSALVWKGFRKGRGLFLVHSNGILEGALKEYRKVYGNGVKLALYNGYSKDIEGADIVFATFQTMGSVLNHFPSNYFAWMTVDEGHHSQADSYRKVIEYFTCPRLAITATPDRRDLLDIRELFGKEVINISLEEAIARGLLPRIEYHILTDQGFDEKALQKITHEVMEEGKRLSLKEINRRVFIRARDEKVAEIVKGYKEQTIIFCRNITHLEHFRSFLNGAVAYHSKKTVEENLGVLEDLRRGKTRRVLAVNAFNEGIDVPDVGLVVFYRATESGTVFRQQLGRGMRPTKDTLIVLDFVGNIERIRMIKKMTDRIAELGQKLKSGRVEHDAFHVSGKSFEFTFSDTVVDLLKVAERVDVEFYPTWQDASESAQRLKLNQKRKYQQDYKNDNKLPSSPDQHYPDFPGWSIFLGRPQKRYRTRVCDSWQQAGTIAKSASIKSKAEYSVRYKEDPLLPSNPHQLYSDFPGWNTFLGTPKSQNDFSLKSRYPTWQEASHAARVLGVMSSTDYRLLYKNDPLLSGAPEKRYKDFPGWKKFLGKE